MHIQFLGAAETVTGSCYLLQAASKNILIDCGMFQGGRGLEQLNRFNFKFDVGALDYVLLTHAHIDHSGLLPKLVRHGFTGPIICTHATQDLCEIMLPDSAHIQEEDMVWRNRKRLRAGQSSLEPLYTIAEAIAALRQFKAIDYDVEFPIDEQITMCFRDAGHILGSSMIEIWVTEEGQQRKIVFSGDIGNKNQRIVRDPTVIGEADYVVIESTYAGHTHKSREDTVRELHEIIQASLQSRGNIIIPSFAVDRTQELIYEFGEMQRHGTFPDIPVFIDSPLAISATDIYRRHRECYDEETWNIINHGDNPLALPQLRIARAVEESKKINQVEQAIIISASGMCEAGRIRHHLKHNLWRPEAHVIIVGYQVEGTLGRAIVEGAKKVKIFGETIAVKAQVHTLGGFSAHADGNGLIDWLRHIQNVKQVLVVHGEAKRAHFFAQQVEEKTGYPAHVAQWLEKVGLG
jgi:metallo-beta-lactamase family protein